MAWGLDSNLAASPLSSLGDGSRISFGLVPSYLLRYGIQVRSRLSPVTAWREVDWSSRSRAGRLEPGMLRRSGNSFNPNYQHLAPVRRHPSTPNSWLFRTAWNVVIIDRNKKESQWMREFFVVRAKENACRANVSIFKRLGAGRCCMVVHLPVSRRRPEQRSTNTAHKPNYT